MAQGEATLDRIVEQRRDCGIQTGVAGNPDGERSRGQNARAHRPAAVQLPFRVRVSLARCSGGICSSSRYSPLRKTCEAME